MKQSNFRFLNFHRKTKFVVTNYSILLVCGKLKSAYLDIATLLVRRCRLVLMHGLLATGWFALPVALSNEFLTFKIKAIIDSQLSKQTNTTEMLKKCYSCLSWFCNEDIDIDTDNHCIHVSTYVCMYVFMCIMLLYVAFMAVYILYESVAAVSCCTLIKFQQLILLNAIRSLRSIRICDNKI